MTIEMFRVKVLLAAAVVAVGCTTNNGSNDAGNTNDDAGQTVTDGGPTDGGPMPVEFVDQQNHSFANAKVIKVDREVITAKMPSATSADYYSFTAGKGDTLLVLAYAQILDENGTGSDPSRLDTVVTVYNSSMVQIAQNDDAYPRFASDSELFFMVPATGTYYFAVQDCHVALSNCGSSTQAVTNFDYETAVFHVGRLNSPEIFAGVAQDGTTAHAATVGYAVRDDYPDAGNGKNEYGRYILDGRFASAGQTHVFSFTPPADANVAAGKPVSAEFWVQPTGTQNGDGSTSTVKVWVSDSSGGDIIGFADQNNYGTADNMTNGPLNLSVPVTLGHQYYLYVQHAAGSSTPATDYYFMAHGVATAADSSDMEPNNSVTAPQVLTGTEGFYGVVGGLTSGDEDWFQLEAPSGATKVAIACSGQRSGSGLRGLKFGLYTASGGNATLVTGTEATEVANADFNIPATMLPSGTTRFYLKLTASSQDSEIAGNYYGCGVSFGQ